MDESRRRQVEDRKHVFKRNRALTRSETNWFKIAVGFGVTLTLFAAVTWLVFSGLSRDLSVTAKAESTKPRRLLEHLRIIVCRQSSRPILLQTR